MNYRIYIHRDSNNQIFYVGCTKNKYRPNKKYYIRSNRPLRSIEWFEHCNNIFTVEIVADNLTEEQAYQMEIELIAKYGRQCDGGILVNNSIGGKYGYGGVNKKKSEESKQKMSINSIGKYKGVNNHKSKQVICTVTGKIWECVRACAEENNLVYGTLIARLSGHIKNKTTFMYLDEYEESELVLDSIAQILNNLK